MPALGTKLCFPRNEDGTAALEFTFVFIPFIGLLLIIVETGLVFLFSLAIDDAAQKVTRLIQTGQIQQAHITSADELRRRYLCPPSGSGLLPSMIPCDRILMDIRTASSFDSANTSRTFYQQPGALRFCPGNPGSVVVVRIAFALPVFLPTLATMANGTFGVDTSGLVDDFPNFPGWNHLISSAFVVQNEPFSGPGSCS